MTSVTVWYITPYGYPLRISWKEQKEMEKRYPGGKLVVGTYEDRRRVQKEFWAELRSSTVERLGDT